VSDQPLVGLTIDGKHVSVPEGTLIIRAAERLGIEVPRFCDHPYLEPVGACRTCLVEVEGQRKLTTSCTTPVAEGMVVRTQHTSEDAAKGQRGQLEFLLINHPLDCPVCDRGGECPLQDQTLAFGPGESRYIDPKRVYQKPIELSPLVLLDRERCVLCARCTRFCDQVSGERFIELFERGAAEQVSIAPGEDFGSPFSGNTVQICPVGALTSSTYRFVARPFDVSSEDTVCPHCASGCTLRVDVRRGEVVRHLARDNPDVNETWLCDKGRYAFRFPDRDRLDTPMLRVPGLEPVSYGEVFAAIRERSEGGRVAFLGGGRLTDEDNFAMSKLARTVFDTNDIDHRMVSSPEGLAAERNAAAGMPVTYADVERAATIVVAGLDTREELPILHLRIRKAVRKHGARVIDVAPRRTPLADVAEHVPCAPGAEAAALGDLGLAEGDGETVVIAGPRLAESRGGIEAATGLASRVSGRFTLVPRRANDRGALRAGVHPALLPGGHPVGEAIEGWTAPGEPGRDTRAILEAAANREIDVLFLAGVDPLTDFPDADLARRALANARFRVVIDISRAALAGYADAVLPAAAFLEKDGHFTDWEGRGQRMRPVRQPPGLARPEWQIFQELSEAMGKDMGLTTLDALHEEMGSLLSSQDGKEGGGSPEEVLSQRAGGERGSDEGEPPTLTLFTYPLLVDEGRLSVDAGELKEALEEPAFVELNPADAERLGIADGGTVRVKTERGETELPARVTDGIAEGAVFVPWNQPGLRANTLLAGSLTTAVTLEPVGAPAMAGEETS
jgi:NADH-quinone oxidoreductase subunit G